MTEEQKSEIQVELVSAGKRITTQVSSGRWLLTMAASMCVVMMVYTDCRVAYKEVLAGLPVVVPFDITALLTIFASVFTSYFHANRANEQEGA